MDKNRLHSFADVVQEAQANIQKDFADVNPLISLSSHLRSHGFATDILTIDEPATNKRIMMLLHDDKPSLVCYQLCCVDKDPGSEFLEVDQAKFTAEKIYQIIKDYFV